jgi:serine acetyltransferase
MLRASPVLVRLLGFIGAPVVILRRVKEKLTVVRVPAAPKEKPKDPEPKAAA